MEYFKTKNDYQKMEKRTLSLVAKERLFKHVNILNWLPKYNKQDAIGDLIAGITVGLTLMPQGIAYASLAGLDPQYGLYSAFVGGYVYAIFGTIKEVSIGPTAVMSLLTYQFTHELGLEYTFLLTFLAGCVELAMGILNLGFLIDFISMPVISGFTSAYSILIIASQMKSLLGLRKFKTKGLVDSIIKLASHISETKLWDAMLGVTCIAFLLTLRKLTAIPVGPSDGKNLTNRQKRIKKALWFISISRNAITVLLSSVIAYLFESYGLRPFILSGRVEPGIPSFQLPFFSLQQGNSTVTFTEMCSQLGLSVLIIPVVAVLANVAIAKAFSTGDIINASQEMLTLGICNILGSCVRSLPTCGAFTRSAVSNSSGVRSPMMGLYSATIIVLALNLLTPYFYFIPRATLAAVLISAVFFMIDWEIIMPLWRTSKRDLCLVIVTFVSCCTLGVESGLLIGVISNMGLLLYYWARPSVAVVPCKTVTGDEYVLVEPDMGLMYPASDYLSNILYKAGEGRNKALLPVVINCIHFKGIDHSSATALKRIYKRFLDKEQQLILLNVDPEMKLFFEKSDIKIPYCEAEEDIADILFGEKLDISRSETVPIFENGLKEIKVDTHRKSIDHKTDSEHEQAGDEKRKSKPSSRKSSCKPDEDEIESMKYE